MKLYNVHPSVCPISLAHSAAAGLLLWAQQAAGIDRLLQQQCTAGE